MFRANPDGHLLWFDMLASLTLSMLSSLTFNIRKVVNCFFLYFKSYRCYMRDLRCKVLKKTLMESIEVGDIWNSQSPSIIFLYTGKIKIEFQPEFWECFPSAKHKKTMNLIHSHAKISLQKKYFPKFVWPWPNGSFWFYKWLRTLSVTLKITPTVKNMPI